MSGHPIVREALAADAVLGESPVWSPTRQRLLWVDTEGRWLHAFDPASGHNQSTAMPDVVGMVAEDRDGRLTVALGCGLAHLGANGEAEPFGVAPHAAPGFRLNDGKFDEQGRLWIGLMSYDLTPGSGVLYRVDLDGTWHAMDDGFTLINGLEWTEDRRTLLVTDSRQGIIYAYDFDAQTGAVRDRRPFVVIDAALGKPDGLTLAPDGVLLSTLFDGSAILQISREGKIGGKIALPVPRPTSCAIVPGPEPTLYVTTARLGLSPDDLRMSHLSGSLLAASYPTPNVLS